MKKFDLELAKAGHPVETRDGKKVRIMCYDRKSGDGSQIAALMEDIDGLEKPMFYRLDGKYVPYAETDYDLVMAPIKKEGWVNIYNTKEVGFIYDTEEEAIENVNTSLELKATIKIEWEE